MTTKSEDIKALLDSGNLSPLKTLSYKKLYYDVLTIEQLQESINESEKQIEKFVTFLKYDGIFAFLCFSAACLTIFTGNMLLAIFFLLMCLTAVVLYCGFSIVSAIFINMVNNDKNCMRISSND